MALSLKGKFRLMVGVAVLSLIVVTGFWLSNQHSVLMAERRQKTRNLVEVPYSTIVEQYNQELAGKLSRAEAQRHALESIRTMRYEGNNYFWINDTRPAMIMHPIKPELNGKDLREFKDPKGKAIFVEFVRTASASDGGFVGYLWPKPGHSEPVAKLSYVKEFGPWGWVIGTGIYIDDVEAAWQRTLLTASTLAVTCLALLIWVSLTIGRSIFGPLKDIVVRVRDIAEGEGDLTRRIEINRRDEIGELSYWFNQFMENLHGVVSQFASSAQSVASASDEISSASREQVRGAETQKDQTAQVVTAMQEMSSTVQQVSENSNSAATAARKAAEVARDGGMIVEQTLSQMRTIAVSVGETANKVQDLGKRSDQIGKIVGVINDIAEQTNMLALNAAIEAARAGEQGRGFAVVADEVRKLAERTGSATREIADMIRSIQVETRNAVEAMQTGTKQVEAGMQSTSQAGRSLHEIIEVTEKVGDMIARIATAATQQAAATVQVNANIDTIAKIAVTSLSGAQQSTLALEDLAKLAQHLRQAVCRFRLESNSEGTGIEGHQEIGAWSDLNVLSDIDFAKVKMAHRNWRVKLRRYLDGGEVVESSKLASHRDCELGKWIYSRAMSDYGHLPAVKHLEEKHKYMHSLVKQVVELKSAGDVSGAEREFTHVTDAAEDVVANLDQVEAQVTGKRAMAAGAGR